MYLVWTLCLVFGCDGIVVFHAYGG